MKWTLEALEILARNESVPGIALRDALFEIKKLRKEKEMSKTVKVDSEGHVSLEDAENLALENDELRRRLSDYAQAFSSLLSLIPVDLTVDPTNPKLMAQLILENAKKNG
jgi:hypothetical protein